MKTLHFRNFKDKLCLFPFKISLQSRFHFWLRFLDQLTFENVSLYHVIYLLNLKEIKYFCYVVHKEIKDTPKCSSCTSKMWSYVLSIDETTISSAVLSVSGSSACSKIRWWINAYCSCVANRNDQQTSR